MQSDWPVSRTLPGGHGSQTLFAMSERLPTPHSVVVPSTHTLERSSHLTHAAERAPEKNPGLHSTHCDAFRCLLAVPVSPRYRPAGHASHAVAALASEYLPRAHTEHACDETDPGLTLNVPAGQLWQLGADDAPRYVPYVPAAHWAHAVAPASDEAPNPHTVHGVEELASWSTVPAAHGVHTVPLSLLLPLFLVIARVSLPCPHITMAAIAA